MIRDTPLPDTTSDRRGFQVPVLGTLYQWVRRYPVLPVIIAVGLAIMAIFAPWVAPNHPLESELDKLAAPPVWVEGGSWDYVLGADKIGRDLLSRIIHGSRISLSVAFIVIICGSVIGSGIGIASGMAGGIWDEFAMRIVDLVYATPFLLIALVAAVVFGASLELVLILLTIFSWPIFARQTRGLTLQLKNMDYVASSRVASASEFRIAYRHILPGVVNTIVVIATLQIGSLILTESVLSYLGVGIPAPQPAWGSMVADGREFITTAWWVPVMPGGAIFLTVFAFNFIGDWLRDYLDPRLRQIN
ncbi:MAG: ABC transporter permease [Chloroflexi bacterium]|nr:ABC transporter permease [Chloroflexota bacterium]